MAPNNSAISHCAVGQLAEGQCIPIEFTGHSFWIDKQLSKLGIINVWFLVQIKFSVAKAILE